MSKPSKSENGMIVGIVDKLRRREAVTVDEHPFEPNKQCSGQTCDVCDETKAWHDKRDESLRQRRALMPDYDRKLAEWLS